MDEMKTLKELYEDVIANGWNPFEPPFDIEDEKYEEEYEVDDDYGSGRLYLIADNEGKEIERKTVCPFCKRKRKFYLIRIPETGKLHGFCVECEYGIMDIKNPDFY